jgi:glucosylglycerate phosphorylase
VPDPSTVDLDTKAIEHIGRRLQTLYGAEGSEVLKRIVRLIDQFRLQVPLPPAPRSWDEQDVILITYADQIQCEGKHREFGCREASDTALSGTAREHPLALLERFLCANRLDHLLSTVHLLPFFRSTSDDGFAVVDYRSVDPRIGNWNDIERLGRSFRLMFDLVLNHLSSRSKWFQAYLQGRAPCAHFFIEVEPAADLSEVTRPRSSPLLTPFQTHAGTRHVWTTFSSDQIDLDYREPRVLVAMLKVLLHYVAHGAQIIRLDAIAYLWKELGTSCVHLKQTHEVVRLMRDLLDAVAPGVWLLTETNVPHQENISYFGAGDEARLVYQFSLPPLLLDAFTHEDARPLMQWLGQLEAPPQGTTYLNFTASHDGIGIRPLEGQVSRQRIESLLETMQRQGGLVSTRRQEDGLDVPYELNIAYVDALAPLLSNGSNREDGIKLAQAAEVDEHARRFLASQAIMLAMQGIPAVYFHSLLGSQGDVAGAEQSGQPRRINRQKFSLQQLQEQMSAPGSLSSAIYQGYRRLLEVRRAQSAFHPEATQAAIDTGNPHLVTFVRSGIRRRKQILVAANVSNCVQPVDMEAIGQPGYQFDLISGQQLADDSGMLSLKPGQAVWLVKSREG